MGVTVFSVNNIIFFKLVNSVFSQHLLSSMDRTLIILALIQLFMNIKFSIMGIVTLTLENKATEVGTHERITTRC